MSVSSSGTYFSILLNLYHTDGVPVSVESPKAKDWKRLLQMSEGYEDKNIFINDGVHGHIKVDLIKTD